MTTSPTLFNKQLSDSEIEGYRNRNNSLVVEITTWNSHHIVFTFTATVRMLDNGIRDIESINEVVETSDFLSEAIQVMYESAPANIPYRHFRFMGVSGDVALEIIAEDVSAEEVG